MSIPEYPKIYSHERRESEQLLGRTVFIQEKIDGSQISFGIINGVLRIKSKGKHLDLDNPEKLFSVAVKNIINAQETLTQESIYIGEYLRTVRHNVCKYDRVPLNNIAIFDVKENGKFMPQNVVKYMAEKSGFEHIKTLRSTKSGSDKSWFDDVSASISNIKSQLGGEVEGVVIKTSFGFDFPRAFCKIVSDKFKETQQSLKKPKINFNHEDFIKSISVKYITDARYQKAFQHAKEDGALVFSDKDIGTLMRYINADLESECSEQIKDAIWSFYKPKIWKRISKGAPEWYMNKIYDDKLS